MYFGKYSNVFPERPACRNSYYKLFRNFIREKIFFHPNEKQIPPERKNFFFREESDVLSEGKIGQINIFLRN